MNLSKRHNIKSLKKNDEIKYVLNNGKKLYTKFGIIFLLNIKADQQRKAAVLLKKSTGNSVKRNYIKRILRQILTDYFLLFNSYNRVIIMYQSQRDVDYQSVKKEIANKLIKYEKHIFTHN